MKAFTRILTLLAAGSVAACLSAAPAAAHGGGGWGGHGWGGGWSVGIGDGPVFWPWPYYYAPPVYYAPPPVYYAPAPPPPGYYSPYPGFIGQIPSPPVPPAPPAPGDANSVAFSCNAGEYVCPMEANVPVGGRCYCRGNDGSRVYGTAH